MRGSKLQLLQSRNCGMGWNGPVASTGSDASGAQIAYLRGAAPLALLLISNLPFGTRLPCGRDLEKVLPHPGSAPHRGGDWLVVFPRAAPAKLRACLSRVRLRH